MIYWLIKWLNDSLIEWFIYSLINRLIYSLIDQLIDLFIYWSIDWIISWVINFPIESLIDLMIDLLIDCFKKTVIWNSQFVSRLLQYGDWPVVSSMQPRMLWSVDNFPPMGLERDNFCQIFKQIQLAQPLPTWFAMATAMPLHATGLPWQNSFSPWYICTCPYRLSSYLCARYTCIEAFTTNL